MPPFDPASINTREEFEAFLANQAKTAQGTTTNTVKPRADQMGWAGWRPLVPTVVVVLAVAGWFVFNGTGQSRAGQKTKNEPSLAYQWLAWWGGKDITSKNRSTSSIIDLPDVSAVPFNHASSPFPAR